MLQCKWDIEYMEEDIKCNDYVHGLLAEYKACSPSPSGLPSHTLDLHTIKHTAATHTTQTQI